MICLFLVRGISNVPCSDCSITLILVSVAPSKLCWICGMNKKYTFVVLSYWVLGVICHCFFDIVCPDWYAPVQCRNTDQNNSILFFTHHIDKKWKAQCWQGVSETDTSISYWHWILPPELAIINKFPVLIYLGYIYFSYYKQFQDEQSCSKFLLVNGTFHFCIFIYFSPVIIFVLCYPTRSVTWYEFQNTENRPWKHVDCVVICVCCCLHHFSQFSICAFSALPLWCFSSLQSSHNWRDRRGLINL